MSCVARGLSVDEVQRLILKVEGEIELKRLNDQLEKEDAALKKLVAARATGGGSGVSPAAVEAAASSVIKLNTEIGRLQNQFKLSGSSALQLQYVLDDLVNTSGNWERHLASISNNIPGVVRSLGGSQGMAGAIGIVTTSLIALAPIVKEVWNYFSDDGPELAKEKLKELEQQAKKTHEAYLKLINHATAAESEEAANVAAILQDRPNGENATKAIAAALSAGEVEFGMNDDERKEFKRNAGALLSDEQIKAQATSAGTRYTDAGEVKSFDQAAADAESTRLFKARNAARTKDAEIRQRVAEKMIEDAQVAGPLGTKARARLIKTAPADIAAELRDNTADAIRAREQADDAFNAEQADWSERRHKALKAKAKHNKESDALTHLGKINEDLGNRDAERDQAAAARETDRAYRESLQSMTRDRQTRPQQQAEDMIRRRSTMTGLSPTDEQVKQAASHAVELAGQGVATNDAALMAFRGMVQRAVDIERRLAQQRAEFQSESMRLQMGPDHTGNYSHMSPWSPGGY